MTKYSYLNKVNAKESSSISIWPSVTLSDVTKSKRGELFSRLDKYCTFSWRSTDAFHSFGAFIINNNDLRFYNGATYTNNYTKPQFESAAGTLTGVSFSTAKISFNIGVYWISEEDYRKLVYWLHPYEVSYLSFGFEPNYMYLVKLASIGDTSTRTIIGYEGDSPRYYTELKLTFDIQGDPCAYYQQEFTFANAVTQDSSNQISLTQNLDTKVNNQFTDLSIPLTSFFTLHLNNQGVTSSNTIRLIYEAQYFADLNDAQPFDTQVLFDTNLNHQVWINSSYSFTAGADKIVNTDLYVQSSNTLNTPSDEYKELLSNNTYIALKYDSNTGLLYALDGGEEGVYRPLTLQTTVNSGERILNGLVCNKFVIPGQFDWPEFKYNNMRFKLTVIWPNDNISEDIIVNDDCYISARPRTNLI